MKLVVVHEFGSYKRGAEISDPSEIEKILASANALKVVKVGPPTA